MLSLAFTLYKNEVQKGDLRKSGLLAGLDRRSRGPLEVGRGAANELVGVVDDTLAERGKGLEGRGSEIDLVRGATSAVIDDANNDRAFAGSDLDALEAGGLLATLVGLHVDGTNEPVTLSVDVGAHQVTVASSTIKAATRVPGGLARHLLAEFDHLGGRRSLDDGDNGDDRGHDKNGQLSELHCVSC